MFSRIMELIDKPAGYIVIACGDKWCRVPDEDKGAGRPGMYLNCATMQVHHAEDIYKPVNGSKYLGNATLSKKKDRADV